MFHRLVLKGTCSIMVLGSFIASYGQSDFRPEQRFAGSSLNDWSSVGPAAWKADGGQISVAGGGEGLLLLKKPLQDVVLFSEFRCPTTCDLGIVTRLEKDPDGKLSGILISLSGSDLGSYAVSFDSNGKEVGRTKIISQMEARLQSAAASRPAPAAGGAAPAAAPSPFGPRRSAKLKDAGQWNSIEVLVDDETIRVSLNSVTSEVETKVDSYGMFGFLTKGTGAAEFKSVGWSDLNKVVRPKEITSSHFTKQKISDFYYGWDARIADVNHDGQLDIVAGPFYFTGPDFTTRHRYRKGRTYNPSSEYAPDMLDFVADFNGDGWPDILSSSQAAMSRPLDLYINPKGEPRTWETHRVIPQISTELVLMEDIDGDGKPEIIYGTEGKYAYAKPDAADIGKPWTVHPISENLGRVNNHGLGVGDINGDGRKDLVTAVGWFEHPSEDHGQPWLLHPGAFGAGAQMGVYDVNGDGLADVVTSMEAHGFGLSWFEQKKDNGQISFVQHKIAGDYSDKNAGDVTFSQPHASRFIDLDGDGVDDFIVGKSMYHHLETFGDPDIYGPAVLYVYRVVRNPKAEGGAEFVPELIDNHSGVGSSFDVGDINKDGKPDVVVQSALGTFIFFGNDKRWPKVQKR